MGTTIPRSQTHRDETRESATERHHDVGAEPRTEDPREGEPEPGSPTGQNAGQLIAGLTEGLRTNPLGGALVAFGAGYLLARLLAGRTEASR